MQRPELQRYRELLILIFLAGVCYLFFFRGLSGIGFLGPDEPRYASVAREMYVSSDYVTPRLNGMPWFEKPALLYWSQALSYAVFGIGEFGARFPSALFATACIFLLYYVCRVLWGRATGIAASLILASSAGYFAFARAASTDMLLSAAVTAALLCFLVGYNSEGRERRWWFLAFYAAIGIGVLSKGPVAILLPALSLAGFLLFSGNRMQWKNWFPLYSIVILVIAAPWYVAVIRANGFEFVQEFLINQNFQRYVSTVHGHEGPFYYYIPDLLMLTFPWSFMLIPGLRRTLDRNDRLLIWFAIVPIVFFSFSGSKLPGYILPSVPPIVMLCARAVSKPSTRPFRISVFIEAGAMLLIGIAFGFFGPALNINPRINGWIIVAVTFVVAAALVAIGLWLKPPVFTAFNLVIMATAVILGTSFVLPRFETTDTMRPWQTALQEFVSDDEMVYMYEPSRWMEYGLQYYRSSKAAGVFSPEELKSVLGTTPKAFFVSDDKGLTDLGEIQGVEVRIVVTIGDQNAFWVWQN